MIHADFFDHNNIIPGNEAGNDITGKRARPVEESEENFKDSAEDDDAIHDTKRRKSKHWTPEEVNRGKNYLNMFYPRYDLISMFKFV
jgi:hypothetical protein